MNAINNDYDVTEVSKTVLPTDEDIVDETIALDDDKKEEDERKRVLKKRVFKILVLIIIILLLLSRCGRGCPNEEAWQPDSFAVEVDPNAVIGGPTETDYSAIQETLNQQVADSMITISMNTKPTVSGTSCHVGIINETKNTRSQVVEIYLDETGELLYRSGVIPVGNKVDYGTLTVSLPKGEHPCTAYFHAVSDEGIVLGKAGARITLDVN